MDAAEARQPVAYYSGRSSLGADCASAKFSRKTTHESEHHTLDDLVM